MRLKDMVLPGETIVWFGAPPKGFRLRRIDALLIPFSIMWGGFAIVWESAVVIGHTPWFFKLWGIPFVAIGVYLIAGRFLVDASLRAQMRYAVTDRAAYVIRTGAFSAVRRYAGSTLDSITFEPKSNGVATIRFAPVASPFSRGGGWAAWNGASLDAFESIPQARHVYELLIAAQGAA